MYMYIHVTTRSKINKGFRITILKIKYQNFIQIIFHLIFFNISKKLALLLLNLHNNTKTCQQGSLDKNEMSKYGSNVNLNLIKTFNFIKHMHSMDKFLHYIGYQDNKFLQPPCHYVNCWTNVLTLF